MTEIKQDVVAGSVKVTNLDDVYVTSSSSSEAQLLPRLPDVVEEAAAAANAPPTFHSEPPGAAVVTNIFVFCLLAKGGPGIPNFWNNINKCVFNKRTIKVCVSCS